MRPSVFLLILAAVLACGASDAAARPDAGPAPVPRLQLPAGAPAAAAELFRDRPAAAGSAAGKAPATLSAVLVMCDFSDSLMLGRWGQVPGDFPPPRQGEILYAAHDSVFFDHLARDVSEYFATVSGGAFRLDVDVHGRTVNLPHPMATYGDHPERGEQPVLLAADVMDSLAAEIPFGDYDTVILVHAGAGEETDVLGDSPEQIYSTYLDGEDIAAAEADSLIRPGGLPGGITHVLVLPECEYQDAVPPYGNGMYGSLGVYCYEVGLRLGMIPLVDFTPAGRPDSQGIGTLGLMGYGLFVYAGWSPPYPCAYNRVLMGWQQPAVVRAGQEFGLTPAERTGDPAAVARVDIAPQEYWLLEYRLQDPDGDRFWSFGGDLNGNFRRDFWDDSEPDGIPAAGAKFDPAADTREWLTGAEWDHFMTENGAAIAGLGGGGSGVYVWHVDESVIAAAMEAGGNGFNADPARKSVDLEEADGIQDLDSSAPSRWYLGADDDPFRAGGATVFGPDTRPGTETSTGVATGYRFSDFGAAVLDSFYYPVWIDGADTLWAHVPADTLGFRLDLEDGALPAIGNERVFPAGVDLRGSDALIADLDGLVSPAAPRQIVVTDQAGGVWVMDGDLEEYLDHDGLPASFDPFAVGLRDGSPVAWLPPAAVGDIDHDGAPEIVLTTMDGLFAFHADGTEVRSVEAGAFGLYRDLGACLLPPVLVPLSGGAPGDPTVPVAAVVLVRDGGTTHLQLVGGSDGALLADRDLGDVQPAAAPVRAFGRLWFAVSDTTAGDFALVGVVDQPDEPIDAPVVVRYELAGAPAALPVFWGIEPGALPGPWVAVAARDGGGETVELPSDPFAAPRHVQWNVGVRVVGPAGPGGAVPVEGRFGRLTRGGDWLAGWPVAPRVAVANPAPGAEAGPLALRLAGSVASFEELLFPAADGRLFAFGIGGEASAGWPVAGPGAAAGTPAAGHVAGDLLLDLVTVGAFARLQDPPIDGGAPTTAVVSSVAVFADVATGGTWLMAGGGPWRDGWWDAESWSSPPGAASGSGIVAGSHFCYPAPLEDGPLQVRASVRSDGRARALIYNLEGEAVASTPWRTVLAREPFSLQVELDAVASGMYLCRLVIEDAGGARDESVVSFAVVR